MVFSGRLRKGGKLLECVPTGDSLGEWGRGMVMWVAMDKAGKDIGCVGCGFPGGQPRPEANCSCWQKLWSTHSASRWWSENIFAQLFVTFTNQTRQKRGVCPLQDCVGRCESLWVTYIKHGALDITIRSRLFITIITDIVCLHMTKISHFICPSSVSMATKMNMHKRENSVSWFLLKVIWSAG